jgi:hypothetical protein
MIRKIIILVLVILGAFIFYKKFMADTLDSFFSRHSGNVDFMQKKLPDYNVQE